MAGELNDSLQWEETGGTSSDEIATGAVTTAKIAADAVTGAKIADDAVNSEHIAAGAIDPEHLAADCVDSASIAAGAIDPEHYAADALAANETSDHADASPLVLLTAPAGVTLAFICHVTCTETVVNGGGGAPTFSAGDGTTADAFAATSVYAAFDAATENFVISGELAPTQALTITNTDGTGGDAGKYRHTVIASRIAAAP